MQSVFIFREKHLQLEEEKKKERKAEDVAQWQSVCLACVRP
jgi:hypothetical protein